MDVVMVVVIVVCALLLGVIVGWVSRAADRCAMCGWRLTCVTCQPAARGSTRTGCRRIPTVATGR